MKRRVKKYQIVSAGEQISNLWEHTLEKLKAEPCGELGDFDAPNGLSTLKIKSREKIDLSKLTPVGAPFSQLKLVELIERNEWHAAAIDAIGKNVVRKIDHKDNFVKDWFKKAQCGGSNSIEIMRQMIKYEQTSGNGFIVKAYNGKGEWMGLQRLCPNEAGILEHHSEYGFPDPAYYQIKSGKKKAFYPWEVIHIKEETHRSNWWGLNCLPIAVNVEFLDELKKLDYNIFRNGLLIDYLVMVMGTLDDSDDTTKQSGTNEIADLLDDSYGNKRSHGTVVIETGDTNAKINVTPLRQNLAPEGEAELEKRYRDGILAYHRVPHRLVGLTTSGQLGGDDNSDLELFYDTKVRPLQERLSETLSKNFLEENGWEIDPEDFNFGNINDIFDDPQDAFFRAKLGKK